MQYPCHTHMCTYAYFIHKSLYIIYVYICIFHTQKLVYYIYVCVRVRACVRASVCLCEYVKMFIVCIFTCLHECSTKNSTNTHKHDTCTHKQAAGDEHLNTSNLDYKQGQMYTYLYMYMYIYIYKYIYIYIYIHTQTRLQTMHTYIHIYIYIYIYTHTHNRRSSVTLLIHI